MGLISGLLVLVKNTCTSTFPPDWLSQIIRKIGHQFFFFAFSVFLFLFQYIYFFFFFIIIINFLNCALFWIPHFLLLFFSQIKICVWKMGFYSLLGLQNLEINEIHLLSFWGEVKATKTGGFYINLQALELLSGLDPCCLSAYRRRSSIIVVSSTCHLRVVNR